MHKNMNLSSDGSQGCILGSLSWLREAGGFSVTLMSKNICDTEQSHPITKSMREEHNQSATQAAGGYGWSAKG